MWSSLGGILSLLASDWEGFLTTEAWRHSGENINGDGTIWTTLTNCAHEDILASHLLRSGEAFADVAPMLNRRVDRFRLLSATGKLCLVRVEQKPPEDLALLSEAVALVARAPLLLVVPEEARQLCRPVANVAYEFASGSLDFGSPEEDESGLDWPRIFARAREMSWSADASCAAIERVRLARGAFLPPWRTAPPGFDVGVYRRLNEDLADMSDELCLRHFCQAGDNKERRPWWFAQLPSDFTADGYRACNLDLTSMNDTHISLHYLKHGIREGRRYMITTLEIC